MLKALKYQYLTIGWAAIILILCSLPSQNFDNTIPVFAGFDKIVHLGLFFVLTVLIFNGFIKQSNNYRFKISTVILIGIIAAVFGGIIELLQWGYFTYRSGDWWDLLADTIGIAMAIFAFLLLNNNYIFLSSKIKYENI